jgi:hypothetical protein
VNARWRGCARCRCSAQHPALESVGSGAATNVPSPRLEEKEQHSSRFVPGGTGQSQAPPAVVADRRHTGCQGQFTLKAGDRRAAGYPLCAGRKTLPLPSKKDRTGVQAKTGGCTGRDSHRASRRCATPTSGSGGQTCRCRKSSVAKWRR